jgi:hypothetical protein
MKYTQTKPVAERKVNQFVVRKDGRVQKLEDAMFGGFDGRDVAREVSEGWGTVRNFVYGRA